MSDRACATSTLCLDEIIRHTLNPEQFSQIFSGRLRSLARAHGTLSATTWQGAKLEDLIRDQWRIGTIDEARLSMSGPVVELKPQIALRLALVFHELFTNASKYGALSSRTGRVDLAWKTEADQLSINWAETGGPKVKAPTRRGFGTSLIEQSIKADGGTAAASYRADGIVWAISLTLPRVDQSDAKKHAPADSASPAIPKSGGTQPSIKGRKYLVVEDEAPVGLELISILEDAHAEALGPASTIKDALRYIAKGGFDGAFLDGNLHGEPVGEVAAALTQCNIPFVFVSGYGRENLPTGFGTAGIVSKPFTPQDILNAADNMTMKDTSVIKLRS